MLISKIAGYFKTRQDSLMTAHPGSVFILPSHPDMIRNSDVHHPYRQDSNLHYLTGFDEAQSCLVLVSSSSGYTSHFFVQPRDPEKEMWEGERYGVEGARRVFGANHAYVYSELEAKLPGLLESAERVFYRLGFSQEMDRIVMAALEVNKRSRGRSGKSLLPLEDPNQPLGEMRLFKSHEEIEIMKRSCQITAQAHVAAMKQTRPGMNEREIEALVDYIFRKDGCERVGYGSIVAGGKNATCLHYRSNNDVLNDGDLLLIDAGGEYQYYSADITRTFPVGKSFTAAQARVYDLVLKAQKAGIAMARPGVTIPEIHRHICEILTEGMVSLGLLKGNIPDLIKSGEYKRFYPHNTSHWLGLDVHDAGLYLKNGEPRPLESGMVLTIEPGFYVQPTDQNVPTEYRHIGIRIEDDVLITPTGCEVLTRDAPKERREIEDLRNF